MNPLNLPLELPIARYRFDFRVTSPMLLPVYAGSTLRGVFGHALRRVACMTKMEDCHICPLQRTCPYTNIFQMSEKKELGHSQKHTPPNPYILEAPEDQKRHYQPGEILTFHLVLVGAARGQLALITFALQQAMQKGVGAQQGTAVLDKVWVENNQQWELIYSPELQVLQNHINTITLPQAYSSHVLLTIKTPMRIQSQGSGLGVEKITARHLLIQVLRRVQTISSLYMQVNFELNQDTLQQIDNVQSECHLKWQDWKRYSNRQQREMILGGIIGEWELLNIPVEFSQLLYIGQWLHIGKQTVFGHGRYVLQEVKK